MLETQIKYLIVADDALIQTLEILRSISGIGPVASSLLLVCGANYFQSMDARTCADFR